MSLPLTRSAVRGAAKLRTPATRRFESTASKATEAAKDTASKATETANEYKSKATEGLSRVTSAAGPAISGAAKGLGNALGKIGGRTGKVIAFVERQIPPTVYYARVGMELSKLVFMGRQMTPPPMSTFQSYFQRVLKSVRNPNALLNSAESTAANAASKPTSVLQSFRDLNREKVVAGAVIGAELLGFFTVGEMVGRMKIVGYRGETAHH
ncbi:mitochondrial ATP synthase g subunit-domain-containing protein [Leptodontidium sp. MPI-SDFR-AT-0119]|nr:mitochondrial ATP synthase g subunit-domain-containing protein [Leptodontidium sp. MPI-SDFR-AT-0119]